jgi:hypothetical protein
VPVRDPATGSSATDEFCGDCPSYERQSRPGRERAND